MHISDDTGRIAMLERRTLGSAADDHDTDPLLTRYIDSNHLQSASLELDETAEVISYEEYHPYGTTAYQASNSAINAVPKRYRYTGKERDDESGLYYHGARYYVPWLGRWTACDPLESKYAGISPYNYSFNNPVMFNDPSGMEGEHKGSWISTQTKMAYNSAVDGEDLSEVREIYGNDAIIRDIGYSYKSEDGTQYVLGVNGQYSANGQNKQAPDDADFNVKESSWGWLSGFATTLYARFKTGNQPITFQSFKEGMGETAMSLSKMNDIVNSESSNHNNAISDLKSDLIMFSKKPSYNQGFTVGGYSYAIAENAALAYVMGAAMPNFSASTLSNKIYSFTETRTFYTVQGVEDAARLRSAGTPWPNSPTRAHLGEGVYSWGTKVEAEKYLAVSPGKEIMEFSISKKAFNKLNKFEVPMDDDLANDWLGKHSSLFGDGVPLPHNFDYIIRQTGMGPEHYFSRNIFKQLKFKK